MTQLHYGATLAEWARFSEVVGGRDLLPVVSNPHATISPTSTLKALGKVPSRYNAQREVTGVGGWTRKQPTEGATAKWQAEPDYGISVQTREVRGIDVDVTNEAAARIIANTIEQSLGVTLPKRTRSNSPKFLMMVRLSGILGKRTIHTEHGAIEFLLTGQQFIACGTHPSGERYAWSGPDEVPTITIEQFEYLFNALDAYGIRQASITNAPDYSTRGDDLDIADPAVDYMESQGLVYGSTARGHLIVDCPNRDEHSEVSDGTTSTVYIPAGRRGKIAPGFKCLHGHCAHLHFTDYYNAIGYAPDVSTYFDTLEAQPEIPQLSFSFKQFSMTGESAEMEKSLLAEAYVLGRIALLGQHTVFYAQPNAGKTLLTIYMLIEAIKAGNINADDVHYINVDDSHRGFVTKTKLAEQFGFNMMTEGEKGFFCKDFPQLLTKLIEHGDPRGQVLVLDTAKKFANLMSKEKMSIFGSLIRRFTMAGGTVISLAHVNKHKGADGRSIAAGTTDLTDDADAKYTLEVLAGADHWFTTTFDASVEANGKTRGGNDLIASFKYQRIPGSNDYLRLLASVTPVGAVEVRAAREVKEKLESLEANGALIEAICAAIESGTANTEALVKAVHKQNLGPSHKAIRKVLITHTGGIYEDGDRWQVRQGKYNASRYEVLDPLV